MTKEHNKETGKLKRQTKNIREMIICLDNLIRNSKTPIKIDVELLQEHKNFNTVRREI